jgi:hypothetical protein
MHMVAAAQRTIFFPGIDEQTKFACHRRRMIALVESTRNRPTRMSNRSCTVANSRESTKVNASQRELKRCQDLHRVVPQSAEIAIH